MGKIEDKIIKAKVGLIWKSKWISSLAYYLEFRKNNNMFLKTMRTDGVFIEYDEKFVERLSIPQCMSIIAHEVFHVIFGHTSPKRAGSRNPFLWNLAADYCVNSILKADNFPAVDGMLYSTEFENMITEEIYNILYERFKDKMQNIPSNCKLGIPTDGKYNPGEGAWKETSPEEIIKKAFGFDEHMKTGEASEDKKGEGGSKLTEEDKRRLEQEWKMRLARASEMLIQGHGPGNLLREISEVTEPKIPWKQALAEYLISLKSSESKWIPPNRRFIHRGLYLPATHKKDTVVIAVHMDTSGSISEEMHKEHVSEIMGILNSFEDCKIHLFASDDCKPQYQEILMDNNIQPDYKELFKDIKGHGGTSHIPLFEDIEERNLESEIGCLVAFTDGCLLPGTKILMKDGIKDIEKCTINDKVITSDGKVNRIIRPTKRKFKGKIITINAMGCLPIKTTDEHPIKTYKIYKKWANRQKTQKRKIEILIKEAQWTMAKDIKPYRNIRTLSNINGDWILIPKLQQKYSDKYILPIDLSYKDRYGNLYKQHRSTPKKMNRVKLTKDIAWLLGLYTAEGYTNIKNGMTTITLNSNERYYAKKISKIIKNNFGLWCEIYDSYDKSKYIRIIWHSKCLMRFLHKYIGNGAQNKKIPEFILFGNKNYLKSYLQGYFNGDGHISKNNKWNTPSLCANTISKTLALQIQLALVRFDIFTAITIRQPDKRYFKKEKRYINSGLAYNLHCNDSKIFKILKYGSRKNTAKQTKNIPEGILVPIKKVKNNRYHGMVYNIEVKNNPTYLLSNIVVHNCTDFPKQEPPYPVIWIINGTLPDEKIPFGKVLRLQNE